MNIKVIVKVPTQADPRQTREHLLRHYRIDYSHLLELALDHWELIDSHDESALQAALEHQLPMRFKRLSHALYDQQVLTHGEYSALIYRIGKLLTQLHDSLNPILQPLVESRWSMPPEYRLARHTYLDGAAVIEIRPSIPMVKFEVARKPEPSFYNDEDIDIVY